MKTTTDLIKLQQKNAPFRLKKVGNELRGFAPIGILECWNTGILGLKGVLFLFLFFTSFQYSIIPAFLIDFAREPINTYNVNRL
ncbi:MAG: hypothetical protein KAU38_05970 [Desulfobacterales bacterium]|nr:hypothetical protein [Desulfobacterales bacterium]